MDINIKTGQISASPEAGSLGGTVLTQQKKKKKNSFFLYLQPRNRQLLRHRCLGIEKMKLAAFDMTRKAVSLA